MIQKFKVLQPSDQFKGLDRSYSPAAAAFGGMHSVAADEQLTWYLVDRNSSAWNTDDLKNLFMSFGLARENDADQDELDRAFGFTDWYKGSKMLVATIPQSACSSYIDGATLEIRVPTGTTANAYITFYGASYAGARDPISGKDVSNAYEDTVYGCASVYLFPNTYGPNSINEDTDGEHPYTGSVDGAAHVNAGATSWTAANTENKAMYPHLRATQWIRNPDDGRDVPYGVALLERGIFVIFDVAGRTNFVNQAAITGGTLWTAATAGQFVAKTLTGGTEATNNNAGNRRAIVFTGTAAETNARLIYRTVSEEYKLVYFCHAGQNEFNATSNHTYDHAKAFFRPEEADDIYVTEIAMYDDNNEVMAYAKLSEPIAKNQLETLTFKVELNIGSE